MNATQIFYNDIAKIRDLFHKYGRFDDANAKLDELSKYLCIYVYQKQNPELAQYKIPNLLNEFEKDNSYKLVSKIQELFQQIIEIDELKDANGKSIFGNSQSLNISSNDHQFAYSLLKLVCNAVDSILDGEKNFDLLNECFGHFVRANFRNNIEDAQYMTPNEVVELICDIALTDIQKTQQNSSEEFLVLDPCCGVGSFLSTFYQKNIDAKKIKNLKVIGQDKVERMSRLSKINLFLANNTNHLISNDNSLSGKSILNDFNGKVDLILTNPPFGAKFKSEELKPDTKLNYPNLFDVILRNGTSFSSEVLFIDRCLSLLKPNGKLLAVIPDSVISSKGLNETLRHRLAYKEKIHVKAIIELPNVTFAQAGTRTKTSILYLEKVEKEMPNTFIAKSEDIGFEVSTKKGATVKYEQGKNDLPAILEGYLKMDFTSPLETEKVISKTPSCVAIPTNWLKEKTWTPNHYKAAKFTSFDNMKIPTNQVEFVKLSDIASFDTRNRRKELLPKDAKCISVLHISDENLNYEDFLKYAPKYMGIPCRSGDLLFSKINPRIVRIFVIPELPYSLSCSSEFEILNSTTEFSNYALKMLLLLPSVQIQINASTSGTSSSHNRIKTNELLNITIPLPKKGTAYFSNFMKNANKYEADSIAYNNLIFKMYQTKMEVFDMVG